jgi:hypothetical protein
MGSPSSKYHGTCTVHIPLGNHRGHETLNELSMILQMKYTVPITKVPGCELFTIVR